jgi:hypothetical protein
MVHLGVHKISRCVLCNFAYLYIESLCSFIANAELFLIYLSRNRGLDYFPLMFHRLYSGSSSLEYVIFFRVMVS